MVNSASRCYLLDANVLLALAWPQHAHHARAHHWFGRVALANWASCAITQLAFVRISANPRLTVSGTTPRLATDLLRELVALPGHRYLAEGPSVTDTALFQRPQLIGHGQVTDLYLLALAMQHQCKLATLDRGIVQLLSGSDERERWIELVE